MNILDILIGIILALAGIAGYYWGLVRQILALAGLAAGAAADGRTAAPSLERHGAAGDQPAPARGRSAPALVAGARALLGPLVVAPGALAQNR